MTDWNQSTIALNILDDDIEQKNRELVTAQVHQINDAIRKVRRISKDSQQGIRPVVEDSNSASTEGQNLEDTNEFLIDLPPTEGGVSAVFRLALDELHARRAALSNEPVESSPVVKSWKVI